jgi:hypothetical protein
MQNKDNQVSIPYTTGKSYIGWGIAGIILLSYGVYEKIYGKGYVLGLHSVGVVPIAADGNVWLFLGVLCLLILSLPSYLNRNKLICIYDDEKIIFKPSSKYPKKCFWKDVSSINLTKSNRFGDSVEIISNLGDTFILDKYYYTDLVQRYNQSMKKHTSSKKA